MLMIVKTKCQFTKTEITNQKWKKRNMKNDKPAYYYYKHNCSSFLGSSSRKFLTYVTKTRPNLAKYCRKLGNYNGTIIFEIDIMKSSPINLKFTFLPKTKIALLFWCSQLMLSVVLQCRQKQNKQTKHLWKIQVWKILIDWVRLISWYQSQK